MLNRIRPVHSPVSSSFSFALGEGNRNYWQLHDFRQRCVPRHRGQIIPSETGVLVSGRAVEGVLDKLWTQGGRNKEALRFRWFRYARPFIDVERTAHPRLTFPDTFMSKTARLYQDTRNVAGGSNIDRLNDELQDVTRIMTKNMEELLWRGDSLERKFSQKKKVSHLILMSQGCLTCQHRYDPSPKSIAKQRVTSTCRRCFDNTPQWPPSRSSCSSSSSGGYQGDGDDLPLFIMCSASTCILR